MNLIEAMNWRYATKRMTGEKLNENLIDQILEAARLAPSAAGLQPYHIFSISNPEIKAQIQPIAWGQAQIVESSHLLVFASWEKVTDTKIDAVYNNMNTQRGLENNSTAATVAGLKNGFAPYTDEEHYHFSAKQAYLGIGLAIAAAAQLGVDATPMEGFDKERLDDFLKLKDKGLKSVLLVALGKRATENDWLFPLKKIRQPKEQFITEIK